MTNVLKNKKFVASAVAIAAVATAVSPASAAEMKFTDVPDRYTEAVQFLFDLGIVQGETATTYGTHHSVKRQDAAVMIASALGYTSAGKYADSGFTDVPASAKWAVDALAEKGFIDGKSAKRFGASDPLTRNETAKILATAAGLEINDDLKKTQFTDVNERFAKYVDALVKNKLAVGKTATQFGSNAAVTRGEAALFLHRTAQFLLEDDTFSLSVMHVNDTHAHLDDAAKLVTATKEFRKENPNSLLLHAGDVFSGTLYFNEYKGEADVKLMNLMNFDAMTFGNHEFDLGSSTEGHKALQEFVKAANFPFVSANVDFSKDPLFDGLFQTKISSAPEKANIYTGIVKEVNGEKVGIFGLTTKETEDIASPELVSFDEDYIKEAQDMVDEFEKMGVNKVIALTHIGYDDNPTIDNDLELAKGVQGIDVIVGGHSHTKLAAPVVAGAKEEPTVIVQTGQYGENLGTLDVTFDDEGVVMSHDGELIEVGKLAEDEAALKVLTPYKEGVKKVSETETKATATAALETPRTGENPAAPSVRKNETALGNIITDGMLTKAKTYNEDVVMAFQNGGGIRAGIDAGPITVGEIITVLPFGNTLATMKVTGAELKDAFETSVGQYPKENGGFLHVSGAEVKFDSSKPAGERIVSISLKNADGTLTAIADETTYTVATNAFTAKGGDGFDGFAKAYEEGRVTDLGLSDWENLREELERIGTVTPKTEGRIVDVNPAAAN
ncbi:5'-nucleotidase C-terminal domain-containing protein [Planococcus sp. NCCP-2050]|uniref:5'-nucleotidase C-terminal domain-containing protein n=1 Tax=Planococcus sp. NCCP-2050 TaxID=2944679 RepID=UPI0020414FD5|nr:5'-nucleotidase C-terminal domain-containing protein [Planococcus sp. NCCP-2050]GKW45378.1 hypothetical protein NCCP2050_10700 [Planococcus sp. NCCP-2050]